MQLWELFVIAVGLSMDAFAVAICKGLSVQKIKPCHTLIAGAWFGGFQAMMPLISGGRFQLSGAQEAAASRAMVPTSSTVGT